MNDWRYIGWTTDNLSDPALRSLAINPNQFIDRIEEPVADNSSEFITKDSGQRAEFTNGGVRDSQKGKARFDLVLPKNVPYRDQLITRIALLMGRGAEKYADRNWEQFADQEALDRAHSSALRHMMQWAAGETDEDHAAAVVFNIMVAEYVKGVLDGRWPAIKAETTPWAIGLWSGTYGCDPEPPARVNKLALAHLKLPYLFLWRRNHNLWDWATLDDATPEFFDNPDKRGTPWGKDWANIGFEFVEVSEFVGSR